MSEVKIVITQFSKLVDRYDAQFYWENMNFDNCIKLSKIAKVSGGKRLPKGYDYSKEITKYRYLRIGDISWDGTIDYENLKYISKELFDKLSRYKIENNDLFLAIVGATIGKCSILQIPTDDKIILTENCAKIQITDEEVLPEYLLLLLQTNFLQKQIQLNHIQTTLPKLGLDRVLSLYLPTPPSIERQKGLLYLYESAFLEKQQKEAEAKALLESIDDYLVSELGIKLPEYDNSLESRMFTVGLNEITSKRFDPDYYSTSYTILNESIEGSCFDIDEMSTVVTLIKGGKTPAKSDYSESETEFPLIKAGSYTKDFINLKKVGYTKEFNGSEVEKNDIFILSAAHQSQYVGRQIKFLNEIPKINTSYVGELICIRTIPESCNPMYLFSLLNLEIYKTLLNREKTGQTSHIYGQDIKNIKIPLPPIETQNEIAKHIKNLRDRAKQLQDEAKEAFENAKHEVEKMILGE